VRVFTSSVFEFAEFWTIFLCIGFALGFEKIYS